MQKTEPQQANLQLQATVKQKIAVESPQTEEISQRKAMIESSPVIAAQCKLTSLIANSPQQAAQLKFINGIHNSPRQLAQQKFAEGIHNSPVMIAQRKKMDSQFATAQLEQQAQVRVRPAMQMKQAVSMGGGAPVQLYTYNAGTPETVTVTGSGGAVVSFDETPSNSVSYSTGETYVRSDGTGTTNPAAWAGVLIDGGTNNAATQLHLVNMEWGGKGDQSGGNIFPGSQSLNGHHKTQENKFRNQFTATGKKAPVDMTYTCSTSNKGYSTHTFTSPSTGGKAADIPYADRTVNVNVSDDTNGTNLFNEDVATGKGLLLRDPG